VLKTGLGQDGLQSVKAEAAIETVRERIRRNPLWKQIMSRDPINSCIIRDDLHMRAHHRSKGHLLTPALKEIRRRQEQSVSSSGTLRTGTKISSSRTRNVSPSRSSLTIRTTRFMLRRPLRCILRVQGCHHPSYVMVWWEVSHQRTTHLHFCKKRVKLVPECSERTCYKDL